MKTPLMIDTMNKRCYDIIPPTAKKMKVLYAPNLSLAVDPSLINDITFINGDTSLADHIYTLSDPPIPLSELDKYNSINKIELTSPPGTYYMINDKLYITSGFEAYTNIYPSTNVSVELDITLVRDGTAYTNGIIATFDIGFSSAQGNILPLYSTLPMYILNYEGKLYGIVPGIIIYNANSFTTFQAFVFGEIDIDNQTIINPRLYKGNLWNFRYYNGKLYVKSGNTVYVYGIDTSTNEIYGITTLDIQAPTGYTLYSFDGERACFIINNARTICTCSLVGDELVCYDDGTSDFQLKYKEVYVAERRIPFIGTLYLYVYGIVYDNILYGVLYFPQNPTPQYTSIVPRVTLYSGDLLVYWSNGVYLYMPELMPWDKCCDIPEPYSSCLYSGLTIPGAPTPIPPPPPIVENIQEIRIPVSDTGTAPPALTEYPLAGTASSPATGTSQVTEATVTIDHVC